MSISSATLQSVQQSAHIEEVVADFVSLKKRGKNLWACCPFHTEKTPSFAVYPEKGFYKCFGCGVAGDTITFVREIEGKSFVEAVKYLADKYGIKIQDSEPGEEKVQLQYEKDSLYIVLNLAKTYYMQTLWKQTEGSNIGLNYFQSRGLKDPFIKQFELGYSPDIWQGFYQFAREKGYEEKLLEKAGLIIRQEHNTYDRFRGKVIFPIHNVSGQVIAFGARAIQPQPNQPKYINSPETAVYHKGDTLYGIFQAKHSIRQAGHCYLVEGYTDVLGLHMAGITNVVAVSGTSLTEKQIQLISRFTQHVTLVFDGDPAGIRASLRGIDMVLEKGLHVKVVPLPKGEDPDSYVRQVGAKDFQVYLKTHTEEFIQFKTTLLLQTAQEDPIKKAEAIREIIQSIAVIPDNVRRAVLTQQCSELLGVDTNVLTAEQNKLIAQKEQEQHRQAKRSLQKHRAPMKLAFKNTPVAHILEEGIKAYERESIRMLLSYGMIMLENGEPLYVYLLKELEEINFRTPEYQTILGHFHCQLTQGKVLDATYFVQSEDEVLKKTVIDLTASPYELSACWEDKHQIYTAKEEDKLHQTAFKNILRLKLRIIQQLIEDNRVGLKNNPPPEKEDHLLQVHASLKQSESAIAKQLGIVIW